MPARTVNDVGGSSSRKRARRGDEEGDDSDEVVSVQRARSDLRHKNAKRARVSSPSTGKGRHRRAETPEDDEDDVDMEDSPVNDSPPRTQYEEMRDAEFRHLANEDADDLVATQRIIKTQALLEEQCGDNLVAQNGILESITCVNFMCHERLHVELGPLLNFIVGENGSGKSAILTAITLCLGGKASATNRGGSLKSFIKEGCDRASLSVKIKNMGDDAYRAELYGDSITVERTFSRTGTSGFKVKSAEGQVISTKKSEVDEVVEFYTLQVDNPLSILSQDNARQFLNASSASEKYRYFIEGVQLEQLDRDYRLITEFVESSEAKAPLQRERVSIAKREYEEACRKAELARNSNRLRQKLRLLSLQLSWSQVTDLERLAADINKALEDMEEEIAGHEQSVAEHAAKLEEHDQAISEKEKLLEAATEEASQFDTTTDTLKESLDEAMKQLQQIHQDERSAFLNGKGANAQIKKLQDQIDVEKAKLEAAQGNEFVRQREKLQEARERREQLKEELEAVRVCLTEQLAENCKVSQESLNQAKRAVQEKRETITAIQNKIRQIESGRRGKYDGFHPKIPTLIKEIERENGWIRKPIGPVGALMQITQPIWSSILEKVLGGVLNDFIVTEKSDQKKLQAILNRLGLNNGIIIGTDRPLDIRRNEPDQQFETILRILKFDSDLVRNQLIINNSIEQSILVPQRVKGEAVMFDGAPPANVKACLCFHDTKRGSGLMLKNMRGNISTNPITANPHQAPRLKAPQDSELAAQQELLQFNQNELRDLEKNRQQQELEHKRNIEEVNKKQSEKRALIDQISSLEEEIEKTSKELDTYEGTDARLENLKEMLEEQQQTADHFGMQYAELKLKKEEQNKQVEAKKAALTAERNKQKAFDKKVRDAEAELKKWQNLRSICLVEKNEAHANLDTAIAEKRRLQVKKHEKEEQIQEFIKQATANAPDRVHIPEGETHDSIRAQYDSLAKQIKELRRQNNMTEQDAFELQAKTEQAYQEAVNNFKVSRRTVAALKNTLKQRLHKWRQMQRFISAHARGSFLMLLQERRFRGKLMINHETKQLSLRVEPDKTQKNGNGQSTKTLSGGEKSFSSICLLLSIWESMGTPLRCLDEFDVFMDNVNRAVSTKMLMTAARRSVGRQYIFITPNAIDGKNSLDKDVKIIRLGDPRQRRLADP